MLFKDELCIENILVKEKLYLVKNIGRTREVYPNPEVMYKDIKKFTKTYGVIPMQFLGPLLHEIVEREDFALREKEAQKFIDDNPYTLVEPIGNIHLDYVIRNYIIPTTTDPDCNKFTINLYKYKEFLEEVTNRLNMRPFWAGWMPNRNYLLAMRERLLTIQDIVEN
ncbi:hypothetical protein FOPPYZMZ_CDS0143 [Pseudomonas phage 9Ps-7B]|nr:hypothetical protein IPCDMZAV_CDS0055 [Pseudomonas phage 6B]WRQ06075.1 hypothetical protein QAMIJHJT_CDS0144 [Pseudomonas phage 9-Ps-8B]WRQ06483.1 hypothetical protein FOPPYZMZ_CDS0143 [Pseudomonas phage 9Ps-7B]WRQ06834.1 hypothetical protein ZBUARNPM_CDS0085 [Pseudomonas phage 14Ps5-6]